MLFDGEHMHRLVSVCIAKSQNLERLISYFRTTEGRLLKLVVYTHHRQTSLCVSTTTADTTHSIEESFHLFADGTCRVSVVSSIMSATGNTAHFLQNDVLWKAEQVLAKASYKEWRWLNDQLETVATWLENAQMVCVNPHDKGIATSDTATREELRAERHTIGVRELEKQLLGGSKASDLPTTG